MFLLFHVCYSILIHVQMTREVWKWIILFFTHNRQVPSITRVGHELTRTFFTMSFFLPLTPFGWHLDKMVQASIHIYIVMASRKTNIKRLLLYLPISSLANFPHQYQSCVRRPSSGNSSTAQPSPEVSSSCDPTTWPFSSQSMA